MSDSAELYIYPNKHGKKCKEGCVPKEGGPGEIFRYINNPMLPTDPKNPDKEHYVLMLPKRYKKNSDNADSKYEYYPCLAVRKFFYVSVRIYTN